MLFFFFSSRRRHTRLQGDWSSDVCSSDLSPPRVLRRMSDTQLLARQPVPSYIKYLVEALGSLDKLGAVAHTKWFTDLLKQSKRLSTRSEVRVSTVRSLTAAVERVKTETNIIFVGFKLYAV